MTMSCADCGNEVASQYRFCPACGSRKLQPRGAGAPPVQVSQPGFVQHAAPAGGAAQPLVASQPLGAVMWSVSGRDGFAGFWRRLAAYAIDLFLLSVVLVVVIFVISAAAPASNPDEVGAALNLLSILIFWVYFANAECGPRQATLGKRALKIKVCDVNGQRISFGRATGRFFGKAISGLFFGIGFLMIGFTDKKQALHDKLAGSLVVRSFE